MRSCLLLTLGCVLMAGCAGSIESIVPTVESAAMAIAGPPARLAERAAVKTGEKKVRQGKDSRVY